MPRIDHYVKIALDALYPSACPLCRVLSAKGICSSCLEQLPQIAHPCPRCGTASFGETPCGKCQKNHPAYEVALAPFHYVQPLAGLIQQYKYQRRISLARPLAQALSAQIRAKIVHQPQLIVAVPLHWTRLLERGFNQSLELTKHLSTELGIPCAHTAALRLRRTPSQTTLPLKQRTANVRGCFGVKQELNGESIAVVDDVMTSGETVNALAMKLLEKGAGSVQVWALARA